tara:strand:+ start:998 stop:1849 length:852 start_codon:yes stop_codon:yes gene_type:complete
MLKHVDIFSGIGGFPLGFEWAGLSEPSMFCEIDPWCRQVLRKHWPTVPITNDVKELANDPEKLVPDCDILTGGYPCQPFSVAGKQKAHEDDRHLWPYLYQIITRKRPTYAVLENVYGHIGLGLDTVLLDLEAEGYSTRTFVVPACSVNAPHRRDRLWIVAYSDGKGLEGRKDSRDSEEEGQINNEQSTRCSDRTTVANSDSQRGSCRSTWREDAEDVGQSSRGEGNHRSRVEAWESEPNVGRVANGIPKRVDRLRGLGNAIVPQIAMQIGLTIKEMEVCKKKV